MGDRNILFDFDGTLMDTWPGIRRTLVTTMKTMGVTPDDGRISRELVGMPLARVFERLFGSSDPAVFEAVGLYRTLFPRVGMPLTAPFDGVKEMLERLQKRGRSLFVVTARNEAVTRRMILTHGMADYFSSVRGEKEGEVPDGKGGMVREVIERFTLEPAATVMIGDRRFDMEAASSNGIGSIGVTYGYGSEEELQAAAAGRLAGSVGELAAMLLAEG